MNDIYDVVTVLGITLAILLLILVPTALDKNQERFMAEKGLCYQTTDRLNVGVIWQYQKCK